MKYNAKANGYTHFIIDLDTEKVHSGWTCREDANEVRRELNDIDPHRPLNVYTARYLKTRGIDVDINANWETQKKTQQFELSVLEVACITALLDSKIILKRHRIERIDELISDITSGLTKEQITQYVKTLKTDRAVLETLQSAFSKLNPRG